MKFLFKVTVFVTIALLVINYGARAGQDTIRSKGINFTSIEGQQTPKPTRQGLNPKAGKMPVSTLHKQQSITQKATANQKKDTLLAIFAAGFLGGLAALLMPCIFPMLPFTVSYFTKKAQNRRSAVLSAASYGLSIIAIYVVMGLLITVLFGPDALNRLATNGIFNLAFFLLLVVFSASFLGAFELTLPGSWINKMDMKSESKGFAGIFFMAATLSLVSFSCTGPIIGTLLVQAAVSGALLGPAIGMFGFSLALAIPFTLFALFPSWMQSLPKSGGWLNSVKVTLGFLELALALKFLSNVDLAYHWNWLDREVFLGLWITIFGLMGIYLLGKFRLKHDSNPEGLSVFRLFLTILVFAFTLYMIPGLWGAPLKGISAFLPPQGTQDFDLYTPALLQGTTDNDVKATSIPHKYKELFDKPAGLDPFFDYREGLSYARKVHKPILIDFTGHACVNCRKMEAAVWTEKKVLSVIRDKFVLIQLYVDDKTDLPKNEQYISKFSGREISDLGASNSDLQASRFNSNSQPCYVMLDSRTEQVLALPQGANYDPVGYLAFLQIGLKANELR